MAETPCCDPNAKPMTREERLERTIEQMSAEAVERARAYDDNNAFHQRRTADLLARLATAEAERDRLRAVEAHRAEILNALAYCSHERILDLLDFPGFQLESLTEAEEQRAAFKAAGIALSGLLRAPSTGGTP